MTESLLNTQEVKDLLAKVSGLSDRGGNPRLKNIIHRVVSDLFRTIEDFDVQPDEFWSAVSYITALGQANEAGLLVPGLGIETFLDLRMDEAEHKAGGSKAARRGRSKGHCMSRVPRSRKETRAWTMVPSKARSYSWTGRFVTLTAGRSRERS